MKLEPKLLSPFEMVKPKSFIQFVIVNPNAVISWGTGPSRLPILIIAVFS